MNRHDRRRREATGMAPAPASDAKAVNAAKARVRAAEKRLDENDTNGALEALKEAQRLDSNNARAWYLAAMIDFNAGRFIEAGDAILKASMLDTKDASVHANCAAIMNLCGRAMEAEAAARHAIELDTDMPEAHCNLGVALEAQGKVADAREALSKAIDLRPGYADALISLGNLWFRAGDYVSAAETFANAVKSMPGNVMARTNLAIALRHLGELAAAEQQCLEAIAMDQGYAEAHNALGNVLLQLGDIPGAIKAFDAAVQRRDSYPEARANLAGAYFRAGDNARATEAYLDVLERHPEFAEAVHGLGVVNLADGKLEEAERKFRRAIEIRPSYGEAWMNIADAKRDQLTDEDMDELRKRADDARMSMEDRISFLFALGVAEDSKGNYDAAFAAFEHGNRRLLERGEAAGALFDVSTFDNEISNVINLLNKDTLSKYKVSGDPEATMIFICGMPRSGTTLVEQMLGAHSSISGVGEVDVLSGLPDSYPDGITDMDATKVREMADTYLSRLPLSPREGLWVTDKTPQNVFFLGLVQILFPNAKVIHCTRDRRDVALSCYFQNFMAAGLDWTSSLSDINGYAAAEKRVMAHWRKTLDLPIFDVAYEDVIADPVAQARKMLDFLGLPWDDAVAEPHLSSSTVLTASNWRVRTPIYGTSLARWKHYEKHLREIDVGLG